MKERITIEYVAGGQPGPYADTRDIVRVQFERTDPMKVGPDLPFIPSYMGEEAAVQHLLGLGCGFVTKQERKSHWDTYLEYLKPINPKKASEIIPYGDPSQEVSDIWEFKTVTPFTD